MEATTKLDVVKRYDFDRLPRESVKAFAGFRTYLDLGPERSLAAVAAKLGKSKVLMERWSRKYDWGGRVAAHVGYVAEMERLAIEGLAREKAVQWEKVHEDQRIAEWTARNRLVKLADRVIARWEKNENRAGTLEGIARVLELASKLGRMASGMETPGGDGSGKGGPRVRVEVNLALQKIYGDPLPGEVVDVASDQSSVNSDQSSVVSGGERQGLLTSSPTEGKEVAL